MTTKTKVIIAICYTAVVAASAYYLSPQKIKIVEKVVKVEVEKKQTETKKKGRTETVTTVKKNKDGSSETVIHKVTDNTTDSKTKDDKSSITQTEKTKEVEKSRGHTSFSALTGVDLFNNKIVYGASVERSILGPINIGLWGLSNGTCGASVGLSF